MSGVHSLRYVTFVERYWLWDSHAECWMRHETKRGPILQYRMHPAGAWHNVDSVEIVTKNPPEPKDPSDAD